MLEFDSKYGKILIAETSRERNDRGSASDNIRKAKQSLTDALDTVKVISQSMMDKMSELAEDMRPEEVKMKLGITFNAETGVVVAKASAEGTIEVEITWKKHTT
ncbi:MAG: CU044_2847 family protein [Bacteroidia bacterium]